jgi:predicted alpha/beta hydrolase family esterase
MKRALLLHGTSGNSQSNWLPWLKTELEAAGWEVWTPDLPDADEPNTVRYTQALLKNREWIYDKETVIVGHSSGALAALGLLQVLAPETQVGQCVLIGAFKNDLGWPNLSGLFEKPFDFPAIKSHCDNFLLLHSDDDPYCPLDHAEYLRDQLGGTLRLEKGQKHFSAETDPKYVGFPLLRDILLQQSLTTEDQHA